MRTEETEKLSVELTETIRRYVTLEPDELCKAIEEEWPEQIAVLLTDLFFNSQCSHCGDMKNFFEVTKNEDSEIVYIAPVCVCEVEPYVMDHS